MTRRDMLRLAGASMVMAAGAPVLGDEVKRLRHMGATPAGFAVRGHVSGFDIVEYTHTLGLSAVQTTVPATAEATSALKRRLESYEMRAVFGVHLPRDVGDLQAFETTIQRAKELNAVCVHAAMTGRRYEDFGTLAAFQASFAQNRKSVTLAEPVLRNHGVKLAIENHKGWRSAEQAAWLRSVGSEYIGVCFDFGNNLSLCEDPVETLRTLAPLAFYCHMKDMAVEPYEDGFLLSEVPLGEGMLDIPAMVSVLQAKDPAIVLGLEMIARDPLKIPVFTDKYWVTFADPSSPLSGSDLAHTLMTVKKHPPKAPLPRLTGLTHDAQLSLEDACIARSIDYARGHLKL